MNTKEKLVTLLVLFLVRVLKPWQYDHQYEALFKEIKEVMDNDPINTGTKET